jgi:DNA gyrase subunit A
MEVGLVQKIDIDAEMQQAYLDYAMSVIVARALPDARDGLKPVHRRILYAMYDMGLRADSAYKKSARIVGEVLGKYHPHGDMAVYEAMARMAQDFSMRYLLVDGQGNFGSIDGDPPAAMRYTEARLHAAALDMLSDIQKNTVDFEDNFDGTLQEPTVMPAAIPNLLVNGATGIAVGMSTSIPPHNLNEVAAALKYLLEHWEKMDDINLEELMGFIQGPDFPTGGVIIQEAEGDGLISAYGTGRGRVTVQARAHLEEMERGRNRIIVTELPYMTNKSSLIERIASLTREEKLEGVADLRDESDRHGMRIVIELSRGTDPEKVLRELYKSTPMQSTFSIIMLALVDGEPRMLSLKQALRVYLEHRLEIIRRRSEYDLDKARQRAHILEGLRVALKNLDEVIQMIRSAADADTARTRLMKRFKLSEIQAQAILDMQLRRLAALERKKVELEYKETMALIQELESLLRSPKKMRSLAAEELEAVSQAYGDRRRTQIVHLKEGEQKVSLLTATDLEPDRTVWLSVGSDGLISRTLDEKPPRLSGRDSPQWLVQVNTRDTLYLATPQGEAAALPVHAVPEADKLAGGVPFHKISALQDGDTLAALFSLPPKAERDESWFVLTVSAQGMLKKSSTGELPGAAANTFTLARVNEGDRLGWVRLTDGRREVLMVTQQGMAIRFSEEEVRPMGLAAAGVMGIKLQKGDEVAGVELLPQAGEVFLAASDGSAKRVAIEQFPRQGRYGQGVAAWKLPAKVSVAGMCIGKGTTRVSLQLDKLAAKTVRLDEAPLVTRAARGQKVLDLKSDDRVVGLVAAWEMERPLGGKKEERGRKKGDGGPGRGGAGARKGSESGEVSATRLEGGMQEKAGMQRQPGGKPAGLREQSNSEAGKTVQGKPAAAKQPAVTRKATASPAAAGAKTTTAGGKAESKMGSAGRARPGKASSAKGQATKGRSTGGKAVSDSKTKTTTAGTATRKTSRPAEKKGAAQASKASKPTKAPAGKTAGKATGKTTLKPAGKEESKPSARGEGSPRGTPEGKPSG